jgi:ATP-dependent DNA helicase RecQ
MRGDTAPDFDGILRNAVDLLNGKTVPGVDQDALRDVLLKGYRYILVDEYQDIDASQYDLISALAGRTLKDPDQRLTLLAVGDDDQNIYGFRHTSVEFIRKFREDYGAEVSYLVENYRSTVNIIESANVLISSNRDRMKRDNPIRIDHVRRREPPGGVWEGLDPGLARGRVQAIRGFVSDAHQAYGAMKELERLRTLGPSWDWSECAVLARNRKSLNPVRAYCEQNRIPCCWGEDDDKRPPFHQVRETASLLDFLRDNKGRLITASELLEKVGKGPPNSWRDLLTECLREFLEETEDLPVPPGSASEWIYEFGLELRRFARRGLWLNTVHSSKGTEFRHVVILDGGWAPAAGQTEEERRLYYVGMTRAQETLTLLELRGSRNAFIGAALEGAGGFARSAGAQAGPESLDRIYENLGLSDVDLSFSGRRAINDPIHGVMAELQVGDELTLRRNEDFRDLYRAQPHREKGIEWFLCDGKKRDVGRLARRYRLRNPNPVSIRVTAVVRRRIEQISDPEWRESCKVKSWEVPLCEIVY